MSPLLAFLINLTSVAGSTFALPGFKFFFVKLNSQGLIHGDLESFANDKDFWQLRWFWFRLMSRRAAFDFL